MSIIIKCACNSCGAEFDVNTAHFDELGFSAFPKSCPSCIDARNGRGKKVISKVELHFFPSVLLEFFPVLLKEMINLEENDQRVKCYHGHYDGACLTKLPGKNIGGSLTFYALSPGISTGSVVSFRHMKNIVEVTDKTGETRFREYEYVFLGEPQSTSNLLSLKMAERFFKTTIKGRGLQIQQAEPFFPPSTSWRREFYRGYRSGRAKESQYLYICDIDEVAEDAPIETSYDNEDNVLSKLITSTINLITSNER